MRKFNLAGAVFACSLAISGCNYTNHENSSVAVHGEFQKDKIDSLWNNFSKTHQQGGYVWVRITNLGAGSIGIQREGEKYILSINPNDDIQILVFNSINGVQTDVSSLQYTNELYLTGAAVDNLFPLLSLNSANDVSCMPADSFRFFLLPNNSSDTQSVLELSKSIENGELVTDFNLSISPETQQG